MKARGIAFILIILMIVAGSFLSNAFAETENFRVLAFAESQKSISLKENDHVSMGYTIIGESDSEFDFRITDPLGNTIFHFDGIGQRNFSFISTTTGTYILHFDNSLSSAPKIVTLNYSIEHYMWGIPQNLFLVIVIAIILVIAVATFAFLGKPAY
jgi:hypothetical protein